jgi:hypothetical protein
MTAHSVQKWGSESSKAKHGTIPWESSKKDQPGGHKDDPTGSTPRSAVADAEGVVLLVLVTLVLELVDLLPDVDGVVDGVGLGETLWVLVMLVPREVDMVMDVLPDVDGVMDTLADEVVMADGDRFTSQTYGTWSPMETSFIPYIKRNSKPPVIDGRTRC